MHKGDQPAASAAYRIVVIVMLLIVYTFNFLDRQILGILAQPIKADLHLSDTQLGALGGIAFALLYSTLGIPLAIIADRTSRTWVVTISLAVWSGFTALCGVATGFWQMFAFRLGVGVGEAGGVAPSYAIISSYFPAHQRARALAFYSLGIPLGLSSGALLGAWLASTFEWRTAFMAIGLAGLAVTPVFRLVVREPPREDTAAAPVPLSDVIRILVAKRSFWLMALAASCSSLCGYGLAFWAPSIFMRGFGFDLLTAGKFLGSLQLVGGCAGVFAGGWLADRLGKADAGVYAKLPAVAWLITAPLFAAGFWTNAPVAAWLLLLIPNGLNILWLGPLTTAVQSMVPPQMRATASAIFLFVNNIIGLGLGAVTMGALSDLLTPRLGSEALRTGSMIVLIFYLIAAVLALLAVRPLRRDWIRSA